MTGCRPAAGRLLPGGTIADAATPPTPCLAIRAPSSRDPNAFLSQFERPLCDPSALFLRCAAHGSARRLWSVARMAKAWHPVVIMCMPRRNKADALGDFRAEGHCGALVRSKGPSKMYINMCLLRRVEQGAPIDPSHASRISSVQQSCGSEGPVWRRRVCLVARGKQEKRGEKREKEKRKKREKGRGGGGERRTGEAEERRRWREGRGRGKKKEKEGGARSRKGRE